MDLHIPLFLHTLQQRFNRGVKYRLREVVVSLLVPLVFNQNSNLHLAVRVLEGALLSLATPSIILLGKFEGAGCPIVVDGTDQSWPQPLFVVLGVRSVANVQCPF